MAISQPPPTHSEIFIKDKSKGEWTFNPIWLQWFVDLSAFKTVITGGSVIGPASATNNAIVLYDGASGKLVKDSGALLSSKANVAGASGQDFSVKILIANAQVRLKGYTVATLPVGVQGDLVFVTDANATTYNSIVVAGGANVVPVFYDGTNWRIK